MLRWLPALSAALLAQRAAALAASPNFAVLEANGRTVLDKGDPVVAMVELAGHSQVALHHEATIHGPGGTPVVTGVIDDTVHGNLLLLVLQPEAFARNSAVRLATRSAITNVASAGRSVTKADVSLAASEDFPAAVQVSFQVSFGRPNDRQAFTREVAGSFGWKLSEAICKQLPGPFRGKCQLPGLGRMEVLQNDAANVELLEDEAAVAVFSQKAMSYGTIRVKLPHSVAIFWRIPGHPEALAMAIAQLARVSRIQVGTLMAADGPDLLRIDFWLLMPTGRLYEAAIQRVESTGQSIWDHAMSYAGQWHQEKQRSKEVFASARIVLQVPSQRRFFGNATAEEAIRRVVAEVAAVPGPQGIRRLTVANVSVSLAELRNVPAVLQVSFDVSFGTPRDRKVFTWDFAEDGGYKLALAMNEQLPDVCGGRCTLPGRLLGEVADSPYDRDADKPYGTYLIWSTWPQIFVSDRMVQEAMAKVISEMAAVPVEQVGLIGNPESSQRVSIDFWVNSDSVASREDTVKRIGLISPYKVMCCAVAAIDRDHGASVIPNATQGSVVLRISDARRFVNSTVFESAVKRAIGQVAGMIGDQVNDLNVSTDHLAGSPNMVRLDFRVGFATRERRQAFIQAMAVNGSEQLVKNLNSSVPDPFDCRLPGPDEMKVTTGEVRRKSVQPYGTMLIYMIYPQYFMQEQVAREALATTIAEVAGVLRQQVGITMSLESPVLMSVNFWISSANATLREVAVQRVDATWAHHELTIALNRMAESFRSPTYMVTGGSLRKPLFRRYVC